MKWIEKSPESMEVFDLATDPGEQKNLANTALVAKGWLRIEAFRKDAARRRAGLTLATQLPLYRWFWEYFPLAQSFRIPGRAAMVLPFPMLLLLVWLFRLPPVRIGPPERQRALPPWLLVTGASLVVYLLYPLFPLGAIVKDKQSTMSFSLVDAHVKGQRGYTRRAGAGMRTGVMSNHWRRVHDWIGFKPFHARLFFRTKSVTSVGAAYTFMEERHDSRRAVVLDLEAERAAAVQSGHATGHVELGHLNNNRFRFDVETDVPALLAVSEPFSTRFRARVDGKEATIYRAEGYELAVLVPPGHHSVEFRYHIRATAWGLGISFATACLMIALAGRQFTSRVLRRGLPLAALLLAVFLYAGLGRAFDGPDLGWQYRWQWPPDWSAPLKAARLRQPGSHRTPEPAAIAVRHDG
jgi:hypothetical protein